MIRRSQIFFLLLSLMAQVLSPQKLSAQTKIAVIFRIAPPEARLFEGELEVKTEAVANGGRRFLLNPGAHVFSIRASGYYAETLEFTVGKEALTLENKLERIESSLMPRGMLATGPRPKSVEFSPDGRFMISAPLSGHAVNVFDAVTLESIALMKVPEKYAVQEGFVEIAFVTTLNEIWVSQMHPDVIHIFSLLDFSYKQTIPSGGRFPKVICVHPDGKRVFVSNWLSGTVVVINPETRKIVATIQMKGIPRGLALSPDGTLLYVADFDRGVVDVLSLATLKVVKTFFSGGAKRHIVIDAKKNRLYVSDMARGSVFTLDLDTGETLSEIKVGGNTNTIALSPNGALLYVSTRGINNAVDYQLKGPEFGKLLVIDSESLKVVDWQWGGNQPTGLAVSPDGRTIAFTDFLDHRIELYERMP